MGLVNPKETSSLNRVITHAPAKLNLRLKVVGRREDGFHNLQMLNVLTSLSDVVTIDVIAKGVELSVEGITKGVKGDDLTSVDANIASRAAELFLSAFNSPFGVSIGIEKRIPVGGGLGGGSSDAGAVLSGLKGLHEARSGPFSEADRSKLKSVALKLGADVPYFLGSSGFCWVSGVGDILRDLVPINCEVPILLILPRVQLLTKDVFERFTSHFPTKVLNVDRLFGDPAITPDSVCRYIENDLEAAAASLSPTIGELLTQLRSVPGVKSSMTGSGSALFVINQDLSDFSPESTSSISEISTHAGAKILPIKAFL